MNLLVYPLILAAFGFAFSMGAHYTGACMGMPYAARAIRALPALLLMAPFTLLGATVASEGVETTVGHGILIEPTVGLGIALAIVVSAFALTTAYNLLTLPTSTIQILVFSVVGSGLAANLAVRWTTIGLLLGIWAAAPFAAVGLGYLFAKVGTRWRLRRRLISGGLPKHGALALVAVGVGASFAMGANDVSNASGAFVMTGLFGLVLAGLIGGIGLALGVLTWGKPLLERVAFDIVELDELTATASQLAQAVVILVSVGFGYFTSMNQALVGAMIGAGVSRRRSAVVWRTVRGVLLGWVAGPVSGILLAYGLTAVLLRGHLL